MGVMSISATTHRASPLLLAALIALAGCASSVQTGSSVSTPRTLERVDRMVERERSRVRLTDGVPYPPLVDASLLEPVSAEDTNARRTLDEAALDFPMPERDAEARETETDTSRRSPALRAYIKGLHALRAEKFEDAVDRLTTATRLSPGSAEPWLALGEAYRGMGNRIAASGAFRRVIEIDPGNPDALDELSLQALTLGRTEEALPYLFALRAMLGSVDDAALPFLTHDRLGRALRDLGYDRASAEATAIASDLPARAPYTPTHQDELAALYRERGLRAMRVGDAMMRLGDPEEAGAWYERAFRLDGVDQSEALARRLYAMLRLGRPASAIKAITESILTERVNVNGETSRLLEYVASRLDDRGLLGRTLVEAASLLDEDRAARLRPALLRASAVSMGADGATGYLLSQLRTDPRNDDARRLLFELMSTTPAPDRADTLVSLIALAPETGRDVAAQASWLWDSLSEIADAVALDASAPAEKLDARSFVKGLLYSVNGQPDEALRAWDKASVTTPTGRMARAMRAQELVRVDRWHDASAELSLITEATSPWTQAELANAWSMLERYEDALAAARCAETLALNNPDAAAEALVTRARVLARSGRPIDVIFGVLQRANQVSPTYLPAATQLYTLSYRIDAADGQRLREKILNALGPLPEGHPLTTLNQAQDLILSGRTNVAYRILRESANENAPDPSIDQLYFAILNTSRLYEEGLEWLDDRASQAPYESRYTLWRSELLRGNERDTLAAEVLEAWLTRYPGDDDIRLQLADVYRDAFNRTSDADELVLQMLESRPFSIDREIVRLQIEQRRSNVHGMTAVLERLGPVYDQLTTEQRTGIHSFAREVARQSTRLGLDPAGMYEFLRTLIRVDPTAPPTLRSDAAALAYLNGVDAAELVSVFFDDGITPDQRREALESFMLVTFGFERMDDRVFEFFRLLNERSAGDGGLSRKIYLASLWFSLAKIEGVDRDEEQLYARTCDAIRSTVRSMDDEGLFEELFDGTVSLIKTPIERTFRFTPTPEMLAYDCAIAIGSTGAPDDEVDRLYRFILDREPDHANANNNLGYRMLERGDDPREAYELIQRAYRAEPGRANIVDSYGWALHKLGLHREGPDGGPGAVDVLRRAEDMVRQEIRADDRKAAGQLRGPDKQESLQDSFYGQVTLVVIIDHLGDALWAAGEREEAIKMWNQSSAIVDTFGLIDRPFSVPESVVADYTRVGEACRAKVRAANEDRDPLSIAATSGSAP